MTQSAKITSRADILAFALAGRAIFTLRGKAARFTFKVRARSAREGDTRPPVHFVSVLTRADNAAEGSYTFIGTIFADGAFRHSPKSPIGADAPSVRAFAWYWAKLQAGSEAANAAEFWHEGRCAKCGRLLTVPESLARGIGPECAAALAASGTDLLDLVA